MIVFIFEYLVLSNNGIVLWGVIHYLTVCGICWLAWICSSIVIWERCIGQNMHMNGRFCSWCLCLDLCGGHLGFGGLCIFWSWWRLWIRVWLLYKLTCFRRSSLRMLNCCVSFRGKFRLWYIDSLWWTAFCLKILFVEVINFICEMF